MYSIIQDPYKANSKQALSDASLLHTIFVSRIAHGESPDHMEIQKPLQVLMDH
jgi:hypothetical protein